MFGEMGSPEEAGKTIQGTAAMLRLLAIRNESDAAPARWRLAGFPHSWNIDIVAGFLTSCAEPSADMDFKDRYVALLTVRALDFLAACYPAWPLAQHAMWFAEEAILDQFDGGFSDEELAGWLAAQPRHRRRLIDETELDTELTRDARMRLAIRAEACSIAFYVLDAIGRYVEDGDALDRTIAAMVEKRMLPPPRRVH